MEIGRKARKGYISGLAAFLFKHTVPEALAPLSGPQSLTKAWRYDALGHGGNVSKTMIAHRSSAFTQ